MLVFQLEMSLVVIKIHHSLDIVKGFLVVALAAIFAKKAVMHIFMAVGAVFMRNAGEFLELLVVFYFNFMTFYAFDILVFAGQLKIRFIVVEFTCRLKCFIIVTFNTICRKSFLMVIRMAG